MRGLYFFVMMLYAAAAYNYGNRTSSGHLIHAPAVTGVPDDTGYDRSYYFMHIPKAGGASMERELILITEKSHSRLVYFYPPGTFSTIHRRDLFPDGEPRVITMFRSPASHVISMYQHCVTAPVHSNVSHYMPTFDEWIGNYSAALALAKASRVNRLEKYQCFNPTNAQSYYMANHQLKDLYAFGILEYFDTSICLISEAIRHNLPKRCRCEHYTPNAAAHKSHGVVHTLSEASLTSQQRQIIRSITMEDEILVANAYKIFFRQVQKLERRYDTILPMNCQK